MLKFNQISIKFCKIFWGSAPDPVGGSKNENDAASDPLVDFLCYSIDYALDRALDRSCTRSTGGGVNNPPPHWSFMATPLPIFILKLGGEKGSLSPIFGLKLGGGGDRSHWFHWLSLTIY